MLLLSVMNVQSTKKIVFNKSILLNLKAELLKKQEEVSEKKQQPQHRIDNFKLAPSKGVKNKTEKSFKDRLQAVDTDELAACLKAKSVLEKKAELYDHLSDNAGTSQLASRYLVDFDSKKLQEPPNQEPCSTSESCSTSEPHPTSEPHSTSLPVDEHDDFIDDDSDWIEFTDCLGRTRKCLKSDLDSYKQKDEQLRRITDKELDQIPQDFQDGEPKSKETPLLVQKTKDYLQSLRDKWEKKEQELLAKDKDIHYQDLLFDEARMHGVGYFSFSTDETERRKQMEELTRVRQETLQAQEEATERRRKRDEMVAARVSAARARRRMREGLPPEDPEETQKDFEKCLLELLTQQRNEADAIAKEEERKRKEELEKERQKLRDEYIRDWDIGKEGVEEKKKFREMTQEEYVQQQRDKRIDEFAPLIEKQSNKRMSSFNDRGKMQSNAETLRSKTWSEVKTVAPPQPDISDLIQPKGLYFTTDNSNKSTMKYKNFVKSQEPVPIENELSDDEDVRELHKSEKRKLVTHSEIAPPPTYDYYGPVPKQIRKQQPFDLDIREAYEQGTKSLEKPGSSRQLSQAYDFSLE